MIFFFRPFCLGYNFSLINEVTGIKLKEPPNLHPRRLQFPGVHCEAVLAERSAKVQTSIQPGGNGFTPPSSLELTHFCYLSLLDSMAGLSLSTGSGGARVGVCVCLSKSVHVRNSTSVTNKLGRCSPAD